MRRTTIALALLMAGIVVLSGRRAPTMPESGRYRAASADAQQVGLRGIAIDVDQGLATFFVDESTVVRQLGRVERLLQSCWGAPVATEAITVEGLVPLPDGPARDVRLYAECGDPQRVRVSFDDGWTELSLRR